MNIYLHDHHFGYRISCLDICKSALRLGSGYFLAKRHFDLAVYQKSQIHNIIGFIESMPILGMIVAIIEIIAAKIFSHIYSYPSHSAHQIPFRNEKVNEYQAMKKMVRNEKKALKEDSKPPLLASPKKGIGFISRFGTSRLLNCSHNLFQHMGSSPFHLKEGAFVCPMSCGYVAGISSFKGDHSFSIIEETFTSLFPALLKEYNGHVHLALEICFSRIHTIMKKISDHGAQLIITYLDTKNDLVYTANLGEFSAYIYKEYQKDKAYWIPLSCKRDVSSKSDKKKIWDVYQPVMETNSQIKRVFTKKWQKLTQATEGSIKKNISRFLGKVTTPINLDRIFTQKPKITVHPIEEGDELILSSSPLWHFIEPELLKTVMQSHQPSELACLLGNLATKRPDQSDLPSLSIVTCSFS